MATGTGMRLGTRRGTGTRGRAWAGVWAQAHAVLVGRDCDLRVVEAEALARGGLLVLGGGAKAERGLKADGPVPKREARRRVRRQQRRTARARAVEERAQALGLGERHGAEEAAVLDAE